MKSVNGSYSKPLTTSFGGALAIAFLSFCVLHAPDSYMIRPHNVFWRFWLGVGILEALFFLYLNFLTLDQARKVFKIVDENLGEILPEKSYAEDC